MIDFLATFVTYSCMWKHFYSITGLPWFLEPLKQYTYFLIVLKLVHENHTKIGGQTIILKSMK